ncbi:MAG: J domain-containing protein [Chloroflexota bacterium]|nr:J domain-containing protein [Chloroflexota bacterium]
MARSARNDRQAAQWKRLGLIPGAPECVIKAAHRTQIALHHPDRGGDPETAKRINIAYDELKGNGSAANEYVAANYHGEPWVVLGITSAADPALVQRAGRQLVSEVKTLPRLVERVEWAIANFGRAKPEAANATRVSTNGTNGRITPVAPRGPRGLESWINLGDVYWGEARPYIMTLTWPEAAPTRIAMSSAGPIRAELRRSGATPSRCELAVSINWEALGAGAGKRRAVTATVSIKWPGSRGFTTKVAATLLPYSSASRNGNAGATEDELASAAPKPGLPDGLPLKVDFGKLQWRSNAIKTIQLTWTMFAPHEVKVEAASPVRAEVTASKVMPGRFSVALSVDWEASEFAPGPTVRGYTLDAPIVVRWARGGEAEVRAKGLILYPALVSASPASLDLGTIDMQREARTSIVVVSSAATDVEIEPTAWLQRVDGSGRSLVGALKLAANTPMRVAFRVHWPPITERAEASFARGKPVRPTGRVVVRWDGRQIDVPVQMTVPVPRAKR